jgi:two-component system, OmpR family, sensor histidine kinase BaeS
VSRRPPRRRLARRLLLGQVLVIGVGVLTLAGVALLLGPPIFRHHVHEAVGRVTEDMALHLDEAFATTLLLAVAVGVTTAVLAALVMSWLLASRIAQPVEQLSAAAARIATGHLDARAPRPPVDDELGDLAATFNEMASALQHTEEQRRRLLGDVAHELRTPLATVEGYLEGLEDGVIDPHPSTWETLRDASHRLRRLVDDLALVSRAEEGRIDLEIGPVDSVSLVERTARASAKAVGEAQLTLRTEVGEGLPRIRGDDARLRQVLANLLDNAIRHTPAGGTIILRVSRATQGVTIEVEDSGPGFATTDLPHVFERFYRADPARSNHAGSGIGLTISRAIVHAHGGELTAANVDGAGARLRLELPAVP